MKPLEIVNASVGYGGAPVLRDVTIDVRPREILAVVGESGSGKSTLGKLMTGQLRPEAGTALVDGRPWSNVRRGDPARHRVQMIFQDSRDALNPWMTARQAIAEAVRVVDGCSRREADARACALLAEVGLVDDAIDRRPRQLSGGQCQRVSIARALAHRPSVLVADEPTSALDVSVQAQVLALLDRLRTEQSMAVVMITHDLNVVRSVADRVHVLNRGRTVEIGSALGVLDSPRHPYTRLLVDSRPGIEGLLPVVSEAIGDHPCIFAGRCAMRQDDCADLDPSRLTSGPRADTPSDDAQVVACAHPLPEGLALLGTVGAGARTTARTASDEPSSA